MIRRRSKAKRSFRVTCIWCGLKIRDAKHEDETGVCLKCFYQTLTNYLHSQKRTICGEFVSDR